LGAALAMAVVAGLAPGPCLALLFVLYLSFQTVGDRFLSYQWDTLLLETGVLACFLAPWRLRPRWASPVPLFPLWALRFLLFRLVFTSGAVKLTSGDEAWRHLDALAYHYFTQPIPAFTSWYAHNLPPFVHALSTAVTLTLELVAPWFVFAPGRWRLVAAVAISVLMLVIGATGNYGFFNLLTVALCVLLVDDDMLRRVCPRRLVPEVSTGDTLSRTALRPIGTMIVGSIVVGLAVAGTARMLHRTGVRWEWPVPIVALVSGTAPFYIANSYGLFAVMTTDRPEIIVEGSDDGIDWHAYAFPWKPGSLDRAPGFAQPHMPRLDWQMWFASLGTCDSNDWFVRFQAKLLAGSPAVTSLLAHDPFAERAPRYVRSTVYDYEFTAPGTSGAASDWWRRTRRHAYCPVYTLEGGRLAIVRSRASAP
jgi:hypothetical protein